MSNKESLYMCDVYHIVSSDERMFTYTEKNTYCNQCNEE